MEPIWILSIAGVLALCLGSFATMLITRLHFEEGDMVTGGSYCEGCKKPLKWYNLIPVFSWLFQGGRCAECKQSISAFYPLVELTFLGVILAFTHKFYGGADFYPLILAVIFTLIFFFYDARFLEVDDRIVLPAMILGIGWSFFRELPWYEYGIGMLVGVVFYALQYYGSRGRWVGAGDMRLGAFMGILLGWKLLLLSLFLAYIIGCVVAIPMLILGKANGKTALPMGAFLMPSLLIFLYEGEVLWSWYLGLLGVDGLLI